MAWSDFSFTPSDGLENTTTYESKPASGARARQILQAGLNQTRDFINGTVKTEIAVAATNASDALTAANAANSVKKDYTIPTSNLDYSGETSTEAMAVSCSVGEVLYLSSSGYNKAKADSDSTLPCVGLCLETGTGNKKVLKQGYIKNTSWSFTKGQLLYVSTATAGAITNTKPSTTGNRVQIVGYAVATDTIYFNPNYVWIEI